MQKGKKILLRIKSDSLNGIEDNFRLKYIAVKYMISCET